MQSFFFPCTALIPSFDQNFVRFGNISVHKRLWNTTIFDLATLESRHHLHLPRPLMELFLTHSAIRPFLTGFIRRIYAASFSFCAGVIPPMPILGRSLLYVQSHCVA
jgi:hypothetical protein